MIAATASPGRCTLAIAADKAPAGAMAVVVIKHRKTGGEARYTVSEARLPKLFATNKQHDPAGRYEQVMKAEGAVRGLGLRRSGSGRRQRVGDEFGVDSDDLQIGLRGLIGLAAALLPRALAGGSRRQPVTRLEPAVRV